MLEGAQTQEEVMVDANRYIFFPQFLGVIFLCQAGTLFGPSTIWLNWCL